MDTSAASDSFVHLPALRATTGFQGSTLSGLDRCAIVIVAYEAENTIARVLDRIPSDVAESVGGLLVSDDASSDATVVRAVEWGSCHPAVALTICVQPFNRGYGGNQRACYRWAAQNGFDHVVMIHGDGQYAPEIVEQILGPLLAGEADAVFGSRMMVRESARCGGMPMYKRLGNRVLSGIQNRATGLNLSEWHCGYRAYRIGALRQLDLETLSPGFDFDTQIILALDTANMTICETPIPTHYGDEKCHVNGLRYATQVTGAVMRHRRRLRGR